VAALGRETDSIELSTWVALDRIWPLPDPWLQTGVLASLAANLGKSTKDRKRYKPSDFMPRYKAARELPPGKFKGLLKGMCGIFLTRDAKGNLRDTEGRLRGELGEFLQEEDAKV
jgi:hypothetical protein